MVRAISNVIGFDDAPFDRAHRGRVRIVGTVCAKTRLDGVLSTSVRRDGADATRRIIDLVAPSPFRPQLRAVLLQGITLAGFNVIDVHALSAELGLPVLVIARHRPRLELIRSALFAHVPGAARKWRLIE